MLRYTYNYSDHTYSMNDSLTKDIKDIVDGFLYKKQYVNFEEGQDPGLRAAFIKTHGGGRATFKVFHNEINGSPFSSTLKKGIFANEGSYDAWVRFASDIDINKADKHSTVGCSIKLFKVPGINILDYPASQDSASQFTTVDFVLQNYPVFFARDAQQMAAYLNAKYNHTLDAFRSMPDNQELSSIINNMIASDPSSVLTETYWSCVPFLLGVPENNAPIQFCKYIVTPSLNQETLPVGDKTDNGFLRKDLVANLQKSSYNFDFYIHIRSSPYQSVEDASDNWEKDNSSDPDVAPFQTNDTQHLFKIATLEIAQQDITQRGQDNYVETLSFNPWRTLPDNMPYGEVAFARRISYDLAAKVRRDLNGQTVGEPISPRPAAFNSAPYQEAEVDIPWSNVASNSPTLTSDIVRIAIHPGIGVSRVGNSELASDEWIVGDDEYADCYIGPETDSPSPMSYERIRDNTGKIKRQGARFRLYGYDSQGNVVREILPGDPATTITWKVTLANRKGQWFRSEHPWDKSLFRSEEDQPSILRNSTVQDRASLAVTPDTMTISGTGTRSAPITGKFMSADVTLGELRTDMKGRLIVLGGKGSAGTTAAEGAPDHDVLTNNTGGFNNSNQWYDDISDGPIHAEVTINGKSFDVESAWVIVAPPNYAPDMVGVTTLYERLEELYMEAGILPTPGKVMFHEHILPTLQRLSQLSWVNKGFYDLFGTNKDNDFLSSRQITILGTPPNNGEDPFKNDRQTVFDSFQDPSSPTCDPHKWPLLYGDSFGEDVPDGSGSNKPFLNVNSPDDVTSLSFIRYSWFKRWADGDFIDDSNMVPPPFASIDDVPVAQQPAMLDKAALHFCLADAFHPGCEVTWPMRHLSIYRAPFRIREAAANEIYVPALGEVFDHTDAQIPDKGLGAQPAGGLTRWMALPWHADTARCRAGYDANHDGGYGTYTPAYWPARVPNQVLTKANYNTVIDKSQSDTIRLQAFGTRENWWRNLSSQPDSRDPDQEEIQAQYMIRQYEKMGTVLQAEGPTSISGIPEKVYVEFTDEDHDL